jgi:hypothetical protein
MKFLLTIAVVLALGIALPTQAEPLVYSGYEAMFEKIAYSDPTLPENQDFILPNIAITRGDTRGIYNAAQEEAFVDNFSPAGTTWAFLSNNPDKTLAATNYADLTFEDWQTANGGGGGGPPATVGQSAVLHLVEQDIYLDIQFTAWGVGSPAGGSFAYHRAAITPSADFDRDGDVDGRDFLTWQRNYGLAEVLQFEGDADFDGVVTADDLAVWQESYTAPLTAINSVPEPAGLLLVGMAIAAGMFARNRYGAHSRLSFRSLMAQSRK